MVSSLPGVQPVSLDSISMHASLWMRMRYVLESGHIPQALLWTGPSHSQMRAFADRFIATVLCQGIQKPCQQCRACRLIMQGAHPDVLEITEASSGGAIKIEQIREIQQTIHQRPQCGQHCFVLIQPLDQLNRYAANALLKVLEEPPSHAVFILIANHLDTVPATLQSRCQCTVFSPPELFDRNEQPDYLIMMSAHEGHVSSRKIVFEQCAVMIARFCDVLEGRVDVHSAAMEWNVHPLKDILWFIYLLTSTLIVVQLSDQRVQGAAWTQRAMSLLCHQHPMHLFMQLDKISEWTRQVNQNTPLNKTLVVETLLLGFM